MKILYNNNYYTIEELQIGGHCGICGRWIFNEIFPTGWDWGLCDKCGINED